MLNKNSLYQLTTWKCS